MIKNSTYIRSFTQLQRKQLIAIQEVEKIKTVPELLFFALDKYQDQKQEIERLKRVIDYKQKKIERLTNTQDE